LLFYGWHQMARYVEVFLLDIAHSDCCTHTQVDLFRTSLDFAPRGGGSRFLPTAWVSNPRSYSSDAGNEMPNRLIPLIGFP